MKKHLRASIYVLIITVISFFAYGHNLFEPKQDQTRVSLADYKRITENKEKSVLVYFHANWCAICAKMKPLIEELETQHKELVILKVDTDISKEVALEYEIDGLPVLMFYSKGKREWIHVGVIDKNKLLQKLNLPAD